MRIGEVSHRSGVSVRMLRHYDALGLVRPQERTSTGYRDYADADLRRILHVEALRSLGMGLAEVAGALEDADPHPDSAARAHLGAHPGPDPHDPSPVLAELIDRTRARIAAEQELLGRLEHTRSRSPEGWEDVLRTVALLRAVRSGDPRERQRTALSPDSPLPAAALAEAALTEDETNTAGAVRWALARAAERDDTSLAVIEEALGSADVQQRRRAVGLLTELPVREASILLMRALVDPDAEVRARSSLALAARAGDDFGDFGDDGLGEDAAVLLRDELVRIIVDGDHDVEASEALAGLAEAGVTTTSAVVDVLVERLRDGSTPATGRQRAVQALGELRGERVRAALSALTDDADPVVVRIAGYLAGRLPTDDSRSVPGDD